MTLRGDTREAFVKELVDAGLGVRAVQDAMGSSNRSSSTDAGGRCPATALESKQTRKEADA